MGVIEDGTVSGTLPETEGFAIHYPGYPSSVSRAVETLGGVEGMLKARSSKSNSLELRFRPEDPYAHPAFGELRPSNNLLLKISKKRYSDGQEPAVFKSSLKSSSTEIDNLERVTCYPQTVENEQQSNVSNDAVASRSRDDESQTQQEEVSADIVARVTEAYCFNGMVDYQHVVPVHADVVRKKKRNWTEMEPHLAKGGFVDIDQEDLMILVPPLFSLKDMPEKIVLKPSTSLSSKKKHEGVVKQRWEMDITPCLGVDFDIKEKINWEDFITQGSDHWEWQMAVSKLFDERPIWPKSSLCACLLDGGLKFGTHLLKRLLFRVGYYFSTGPFRQFWIRKGYDPRTDPESRIYQSIDFRVPPPLRNSLNVNIKARQNWKDLCAFRVFPYQSQTSLQLFDLVDDYIQQEITKPTKHTFCSSSTGWFSSHELDSLRLRVAVRFLSAYPKSGAEDLLKSAIDRFEKSKRVFAFKRDFKSGEVGLQDNNKDSSRHASREGPMKVNDTELVNDDGKDEPGDDDECNDGQYELEEEEDEEEELGEYEALQEDGDFFLQPSSLQKKQTSYIYITESVGETNVSKDYLLELFGSFPLGRAGDSKAQDADNSDGEYQILEQDSGDDSNYSHDDDYC